jgi:hypothetical protein
VAHVYLYSTHVMVRSFEGGGPSTWLGAFGVPADTPDGREARDRQNGLTKR